MGRTITLDEVAPPDSYMHRARWLHALGRTDEAHAVLDDCLDARADPSPSTVRAIAAARKELEAN